MNGRVQALVVGVVARLPPRYLAVFALLAVGTLSALIALAAGEPVLCGLLLLGAIVLAALCTTRGIIDVGFPFLLLFFIYQVFCPLLYYYDISWVVGIKWIKDKHNVFLEGGLLSIAALLAYLCGRWLANRFRVVAPNNDRQLLAEGRVMHVAWTLLGIAFVCWLITFIYSGMPLDNFAGRPPTRHRSLFYGLFGHGYLLALPFLMNIALLLLLIHRPRLHLFSVLAILFFYLVLLFNSMTGSRLVLLLAPVSFIMMKNLLVEGELRARNCGVRYRAELDGLAGYSWKHLLGMGGVVYFLAMFYAYYRGGAGGSFLGDFSWFHITNVFDTSITFQFVLDSMPEKIEYWWGASGLLPVLMRVPSVLFPEKHEYMFDSAMFTHLIYGYDQLGADAISRGASLFSDLYVNFGPFGLIIAMALFGMLNGWLWRMLARGAASNLFLVLYVLYGAYFLPYLFKSGLFPGITYIDVRVLPFVAIVVLFYLRDVYRKRALERSAGGAPSA